MNKVENIKKIEYRTFEDMSICIRKNMYKLKEDFDLIVGIPRSGMIPAFMIALFKNIKACSIDEFINGTNISSGLSRETKKVKKIKNVLIVDDSIHSGVSLSHVKERLEKAGMFKKYKIKFLAIFAREKSINLVDYWFEIVPTPRMFEWNYLNININEKSCFDIDGVLCVDPTNEENDDGEKYRKFLLNAKPLYIPEYTIHTLVTSRLEKYRKETETWLKKHNVKYNNLVMLDLKSKEERIKLNAHSTFKAKVYAANTDTVMFVESEPKQAEEIANLSGKPCICVQNNKLYEPNFSSTIPIIDLNDYKNVDKKKVLLYSHEFTYTGAPHSLLRICKVILKLGHYVEVWGPIDGEFKKEFENLGVKTRIIPYSALKLQNIKQAIANFNLAIVNTMIPHLAYLAISQIIPTIWYIREATNMPDICKGVPLREEALKKANQLYCVSEYAADFIKKHYNKNVKVIHNCVEDFGPISKNIINNNIINFVSLGTITERKAFDIYLNAFEKLPKEYQKRAHLYFAGRLISERKNYWEPILKQAEQNENITYVGEITNIDEKIKFMKKMNVVVVPSRDESCSLVVLEGASMGKPLIVTENVGAKYMVNKNNGIIVKTNDIDSLSQAYKYFIDNVSLIPKMSKASRESYEKQATIDLYEQNIGKMITDNLKINIKKYRNKKALKNSITNSLITKGLKSLKNEGSTIAFEKLKIKLGLRKTLLDAKTTFTLGSSVSNHIAENTELSLVKGKISNISFLSSVCNPVKNVNLLSTSDFNSKMINIDCQKSLFQELSDKKCEYLIFDTLDERYSINKIKIDNDESIITKSLSLANHLPELDKKATLKMFKFSEEKQKELIKKFCNKLKIIYPENRLIFIETELKTKYINLDGKIQTYPDDQLKIILKNNEKLNLINNEIKKNLPNCHIVDMKKYCIAVQKDNKYVSPIDFSEKFFKIAKNKINKILK